MDKKKKPLTAYNFSDWEWLQDEIDLSHSEWHCYSVNFCSGGCGDGSGDGAPSTTGGKSCVGTSDGCF